MLINQCKYIYFHTFPVDVTRTIILCKPNLSRTKSVR